MKIQNIQTIAAIYQNKTNNYYSKPTFNGVLLNTKSLSKQNIGKMKDGIIGKIEAKSIDGKKVLLDVDKFVDKFGLEYYTILDKSGGILGEIELKPIITNDAKHVWIEHLVSHYSRYLEWGNYKGIGTRLMQIALKRSEEAGCDGNIELFTTEIGKDFYKKIGMETFFPVYNSHQQHRMYLTQEGKQKLKALYGGL